MLEHELTRSLRPITTDETSVLSQEYFNTQYGYTEKPVLFSKAFSEWLEQPEWRLEALSRCLTQPQLLECREPAASGRAMTLGEYLQDGEQGFYYYKTQLHLQEPALYTDLPPRHVFDCWYAGNPVARPKKQLSWLYVGARNSFSDTHRDIWGTSAWNFLFEGRKLWLIYPKAYAERIRKSPAEFSILRLLQDETAAGYRPMFCIQQPGELVFVPNNCYHAAFNLELSVSVTENFINETNYDQVRSFFRAGTNRKNMADIESIIRHGFEKIKLKKTVGYENQN
ncbi:hypothetical protein C7T94_05935 [Pedobacter yulinensis]|uniref:JmjC domain-containing protein n=1 Tax=Pedobacter yulinensis TaxID=2126353 RepID=A0A2T3HPA7_9SPHI|nr:hypothetical protein [Pedobacter yulinensis]PST84259.1 hypothetical protein C7T94_05935 [Pedobacter yulinensis]